MRISAAVALAAITACATTTSRRAADLRPATEGASPALQAFAVAVELLPSPPGDASAAAIADAFEKLATALKEISTDRALVARAERLHVLAGELGGGSANPSRVVEAGLREAVDALSDLGVDGGVRQAHDAAAAELVSFDTVRPLRSQGATVRATLRHVANGLLAAQGLPPAVEAHRRPPDGVPAGTGPRPSLDAARRLSAAVSRLATSPASDLKVELPAALDALAAAVSSAAGDDAGELARLANAIRGNADQIRRMDVLGVEATPLGRSALERGADATAFITARTRSDVATDWITRARAATEAIDPRSFLSFQRAPIQEALRLLADALVCAAER